MPIVLHRIDDRLVHGQVVLGWGAPLDIQFIVLMDNSIAESDWEMDLYRLGVPPHIEIIFSGIEGVAANYADYAKDKRRGILLTGSVEDMLALVRNLKSDATLQRNDIEVNLGGLHARSGRSKRLRYIYLSGGEEVALGEMAALGAVITAQDVPSARPVPLKELQTSVPE